jgi:hypothetical protein
MFAVMLEKIGEERRFVADEEGLTPLFMTLPGAEANVKEVFAHDEDLQSGDLLYVVSVFPDKSDYARLDNGRSEIGADHGTPEVRSTIRKYSIAVQQPLQVYNHNIAKPKRFLTSIPTGVQYFADVAMEEIANA